MRAVELGHLQVITKDLGGRIESLSTTFLLLLPVGQSEITPPPPPFERAYFALPEPKGTVTGGLLIVEGAMWPFNEQSIVIELADETGRIINSKLLTLTGDTYKPFSVEIAYQVFVPTQVRLSIQQSHPRLDGTLYLYSQLITLAP